MGWSSYLDSIVTRVAAVSGISTAYRSASVDPDKMVKIPRWPKAIISDLGGQLDPYSGTIYDRQFAVTIAILYPRGVEGGAASQQLGTLAEAVVTALTHTRDSGEISLIGDIGEQVESVGGPEIYMQTQIYSYSVEA
jgi:hypothetical protein